LEGPIGISYILNMKSLYIQYTSNISYYLIRSIQQTFISKFKSLYRGVIHGYSMEIRLSGIGYKSRIINNFLSTYIGESVFTIIKLHKGIIIRIRRYRILILAIDKNTLHNLIRIWCNIRSVDSYTAIGIHIRNEPVYIKPGKIRT